ncbi:MAG: LPS export ABC transporter permease LptF [Syntrophales bacterium]|nr:LPS export ABC transporter permease LptF [Syntrophales bacterium]
MKNRLLTKYIFREILYPFFLILLILTFVLLMGRLLQLMDLVVNKGVGVFTIAQLILFLMPSFFVITIPISLLIAILISLGRLSRDNEILVMKSAGISLYQLIPPVAVFSVAAFVATAVTGIYLAPLGNSATKFFLIDMAKQNAGIGIKEKIFNDTFEGIILYADKIPVDGTRMEGLFISDNRLSAEPTTIVAKRGYLITDPQLAGVILRLENGSTHTVGTDLKTYKKMDFSSYDVFLNLTSTFQGNKKGEPKDSKEMTLTELFQDSKRLNIDEKQKREYRIELHKKFTLPLSCLVFGLLALPLSLVKNRTAKSRGFIVGLVIVIIYYALQLWGQAMGETGKIPVFLGIWLPPLAMGAIGIYLLTTAAKERSVLPLEILSAITHRRAQKESGKKTCKNVNDECN